jgi:CHAT domain-containing protein
MDVSALAEQLRADPASLPALVAPLTDEEAAALVDHLKSEADRHWWINANVSLEFADLIIGVGQARGDTWQLALGTMARGDALKFLGQIEVAWQSFETAGHLFREIDDEVGWARTRIGRLVICMSLNRVNEAITDAMKARNIFVQHGDYERLLGITNNTAIVQDALGNYNQALELYQSALEIAQSLNEKGKRHFGLLSVGIGHTYRMLGQFRSAAYYYEQALTSFSEQHQTRGIALAKLNSAEIAMAQGNYSHALQLLHHAQELYLSEQLITDATHVGRVLVECYILLNRYTEARHLAKDICAKYRAIKELYRVGLTLLLLATAEAELQSLEAAGSAFNDAETIFRTLDTMTWVAKTQLRHGQVALQQGNIQKAEQIAKTSAAFFRSSNKQVDYAEAILLQGRINCIEGNVDVAQHNAMMALQIARQCNIPPLRYGAYLLLGQIAELQGNLRGAARYYNAAIVSIDRVQRGLTITLRPNFLEDKSEALRALMKLHLQSGRVEEAFETLERAKSQTLMNYLSNHDQLRWADQNPRCGPLLNELNRLREEHYWFYRLAYEPPLSEEERRPKIDQQQAREEIAVRERRMRAITEQLYLLSSDGGAWSNVKPPRLPNVQRTLSEQTLLVEFYNDGANVWAFSADNHSLEIHQLPIMIDDLHRLLSQLQVNFQSALNTGVETATARNVVGLTQRLLQRLYRALLKPLEYRLRGRHRLVIVPYGALHYLPFHLLHTDDGYLIEKYESVILPTSGLLTRPSPARPSGALILAHSWQGRLPQTLDEAHAVHRLFDGMLYAEADAMRSTLCSKPVQILHIAAHGEHRLDQPDLSYIQLADGQLYADDLLQHDMSYELVTLSACETGRANVAGGDELIGIGRGFLYAGAGALVTSLWRIPDASANALMERMYTNLRNGASKAAALRNAQRAILAESPQLHPAFWGAFQLVGDAEPLSRINT